MSSQIAGIDDLQKIVVLASHRIVALPIAMEESVESELKRRRHLEQQVAANHTGIGWNDVLLGSCAGAASE
jgi:hypothetical protein